MFTNDISDKGLISKIYEYKKCKLIDRLDWWLPEVEGEAEVKWGLKPTSTEPWAPGGPSGKAACKQSLQLLWQLERLHF